MKKIILALMLAVCSLFGNTLTQIKEKGVIRIGIDGSSPPFSVVKDGGYSGFEILLIEGLVKEIFGDKGSKIQYVVTVGDDRIKAVQDNRVDLDIALISVTKEREKLVDFSDPYFSVNIGVLTRSDDNIRKVSDLNGKTILAQPGTTVFDYFTKQGYNVVPCASANECFNDLKSGKGDGYGDDNLLVFAYAVVDYKVEVNIKNLGSTDFLAIAVQKGNTELLNAVNAGLIELSKKGFFTKIFDESIEPFYKGTIDKKYFLLDDLYSLF